MAAQYRFGATEFLRVTSVSELVENYVHLFEVEGQAVILVRIGDEIFAFDGICTHAEFELGPGLLRKGCIECPMHMAQFNAEDGTVIKGPATEGLDQFAIEVRDEDVYVEADWL